MTQSMEMQFMAVPKFFEFFEAFLKSLKDGELHTAKEVREK